MTQPSAEGPSSAVSASDPVYLLKEKAHGRAAAGLECNQYDFMRLFGIIEPEFTDETDWECPVSDETAEILMTASRHQYFENIRRKNRNDGLVFD